MAEIGVIVFQWIVVFIANNIMQLVLLALIGYFGSKITKFVQANQWAQTLLIIADDLTDEILLTDPTNQLAKFLDKAVDKLMKVTGVSKEVAERVLTAAFVRANLNGNTLAIAKLASFQKTG